VTTSGERLEGSIGNLGGCGASPVFATRLEARLESVRGVFRVALYPIICFPWLRRVATSVSVLDNCPQYACIWGTPGRAAKLLSPRFGAAFSAANLNVNNIADRR